LPAPEQRGIAEAAFAAPRGPREEQLAGIWQEVLGVPRVGRHDNFFELGGHSLQATQVVSRMRQQDGAAISLSLVFEAPTLAELAAASGEVAPEVRSEIGPEIRPEIGIAAIGIAADAAEDLAWAAELPDEDLDALLRSLAAEEER
jgi:aryl carrier-like protein